MVADLAVIARLLRLWRGELPLAEAFWTWTVMVGLVVNLVTSLGFLVLLQQDMVFAALFVGYGLSLPYNLLAAVGVWRSAARHDGPDWQAGLARAAAMLLLLVLSVT
jgi:hypothetical protein